jgi:DNA-binding NarL/FixJ family response regulator
MPDPATAPTAPASPVAVVFTDTVLRRFLFGVVLVMTAVVCGVAAAAFWTSFEAIRAFAERSGGINPEHAWLAPLLVDSFIFVASAADLWCSATGASRSAEGVWQRAVTWLPKALLGVAAGGSFALNIAHAPTHLGARVVAALAPAALVLTFEILMMIVRRAVAARVTRLSATAAVSAASNRPDVLTPTAATALTPADERPAAITPRRGERPVRVSAPGGRERQSAAASTRAAEVRRLYLEGVTVAEEIARRLQIPPSTTRRLLGQVKRELAAHPADASGEQVNERPAGLDDEHTATADRQPEPDRDGQPPERALVAVTRAEVPR